MPQAKTIELTDHFEDFIDRQLDQGSFASASEVVEAGLRLLEARETGMPSFSADDADDVDATFDVLSQTEAEHRAISEALEAGEQSGNYHPVDFKRLFDEVVEADAKDMSRGR